MTYVAAEARQQLLDTVAEAIDALARALAALGAAYELLDERGADRLEEELFRPVQSAYGTAKRTHAAFAARHGLPGREFAPATAGASARDAKGAIQAAVEAVGEADGRLSWLQDSMLPVEVGDPELRAGLADVRSSLADVTRRAREQVRVFGR
jgi:hypothetical protein